MDTFYYVWINGVIGLLIFIYYYYSRNSKYWELRGVPFEKPLILFGNLKERVYRKKSFHEFHKDYYFKFKGQPFYGLYEGTKPTLYVSDPELIKMVLIKDFDYFQDRPSLNVKQITPYFDKMLISLKGNEWKQVRTILTPVFSSGKLKAMVDIENKCGAQIKNYIFEKIKENGGSSANLDMKETLGKFTMDVIASTAFGVELDSNSHPNSEFAKKVAKFGDINDFMRILIFCVILFDLPDFVTNKIHVSFINLETMQFLEKLFKDTSLQRKQNGIRRNDFLQMLIEAQSEPLSEENSSPQEATKGKGNVLSEIVAIAQAIIFFIAGYETSSTLLTMICYELAKNKSIQEKLRSDILKKLNDFGGEISYDMINDVPYLDMVLCETLRIYPPVARLERVCLKEYKLAHLDLKPGDRVFIPVYGIHLDPEYYQEPYEFKPERFSSEEKAKRHPCVYLPFGTGPRNCIGLRFALLSTKICLIHLLKEFHIDICAETQVPFKFDRRSFLLKPNGAVTLRLSHVKEENFERVENITGL